MVETKEELLSALNKLGLFKKLLVTCKPTERYKGCIDHIESSDERYDEDDIDKSSNNDKIKVLLLFNEDKTKETNDDIRRIIKGESIVSDINDNSDEGVKIEGKDSFLNLITISDFYNVDSYRGLKQILLEDEEPIGEESFYNFINNVDNDNNVKLMEGLGLNVNKIKSVVNEFTIEKDFEDIKEMIRNDNVDKDLISRVDRRHMNDQNMIDLLTKYKMLKHFKNINLNLTLDK